MQNFDSCGSLYKYIAALKRKTDSYNFKYLIIRHYDFNLLKNVEKENHKEIKLSFNILITTLNV